MKKNSSGCKGSKASMKATKTTNVTVGMDLGDKTSRYCMLDENGEVLREASVATTKKAMTQVFATMKPCRVAIEVGTHSPWVSRLLKSCGHEVIVANARQVQLISKSSRKNDRMDAQTLARLARVDPRLLRPIQHRSEQAQGHLRVIRVRAALVEARTMLVNAARGLTKRIVNVLWAIRKMAYQRSDRNQQTEQRLDVDALRKRPDATASSLLLSFIRM